MMSRMVSCASSLPVRGKYWMATERDYSALETLRDGRPAVIRSLKADDRATILGAIDRTKRPITLPALLRLQTRFHRSRDRFLHHCRLRKPGRLGRCAGKNGEAVIAGGACYIVIWPNEAEIAFAITGAYQRQGVGSALLRHLVSIASQVGLKKLGADVLPENIAMLKVLTTNGFKIWSRTETGATHIALQLP
jgi:GNAT superfamily N-acetyltransferase